MSFRNCFVRDNGRETLDLGAGVKAEHCIRGTRGFLRTRTQYIFAWKEQAIFTGALL